MSKDSTYTNILNIIASNSEQTVKSLDAEILELTQSLVDKVLERAAISAVSNLNRKLTSQINGAYKTKETQDVNAL
jgi:hypothetical protein